ncbi:MAG: hypothetical protein HDR26_10165 [Lachnospiraceae bacterium]|nr:hypothetical protein [Lachnospiraceae bacterium]
MDGNGQERDYGSLENIQAKINRMRQESVDERFTQYLMQAQTRLDQNVRDANLLSNEIDNNYKIYQSLHMPVVPQTPTSPVVPQTPVSQIPPQMPAEPAVPQVPVSQIPPQMPAAPVTPQVFSQPVYIPQGIQGNFGYKVPPVKKKSDLEFQIGAGLFCIIGILFILVAFVMMGMTYMSGMIKGLSLYLMAAVIIAVSEVLIRRRMEKISLGITGLGIGCLYASTLLNLYYLHNFNSLVALGVTLAVTILAIFIGRKKDSGIIKVISFIGSYICFMPVARFGSDLEFITVTGMLFLVNVMTLALPVKKGRTAVHVAHMISNMVLTLMTVPVAGNSPIDSRLALVYILLNIFVIGLIFLQMEKDVWKRRNEGAYVDDAWIIALYGFTLFMESAPYAWCVVSKLVSYSVLKTGNIPVYWMHVMVAAYGLTALILFVLMRKSNLKWIQYYALVAMVFVCYVARGDRTSVTISVLAVFLASKLLARVRALKISEIVITLCTVFVALVLFTTTLMSGTEWYSHAFAAAFLLSIFALYHYKPLYQAVITFVLTYYITMQVGKLWPAETMDLIPALNVGVLFLLLLLFNHVKWWRGRYQKIYNYGNLGYMLFWCFASFGSSSYLNCTILAVLGTAVVILAFQPLFCMDFRWKYLFMVMFWTYMAVISDAGAALVTSSILMAVAIGSVIIGFALTRKEVRIYGLVLAVLVCLKVLFYDFLGMPLREKMLLFLIVGVIILAISCIYIILEKKMVDRETGQGGIK